jgi:hypothetical protein
MDYFSGKKQKIDAWRASSKKVSSTSLVNSPFSAFHAHYSNTPLLHYSMQLVKKIAVKNTVIPVNCINSDSS